MWSLEAIECGDELGPLSAAIDRVYLQRHEGSQKPQRAARLGQAMDGNTMRWLGTFLHAANTGAPKTCKPTQGISLGGGFTARRNRFLQKTIARQSQPLLAYDYIFSKYSL